jgi:hypothetical protein
VKVKDALAEKLAATLKQQESEGKVSKIILENQTFKEKVNEQDQSLKRQQQELQTARRLGG